MELFARGNGRGWQESPHWEGLKLQEDPQVSIRGGIGVVSVTRSKVVAKLVHELNSKESIEKNHVSRIMAQTRVYSSSDIISSTTYHGHIPNSRITHTNKIPVQISAQAKSKIWITNHTPIGHATTQTFGKQRMVQVRLDPRWRGVMPRRSAKSGNHGIQRHPICGCAVVVAVQVDVKDI